MLPALEAGFPSAIRLSIVSDRSISIRDSFIDVKLTLMGTIILVIIVIFVFLRELWATIIPTATVPLSLVGTFAVMYELNYSLDNLSLMALTLAAFVQTSSPRIIALPPSAAVPDNALAAGAAWYRDKHNSLQSRGNSQAGLPLRIRLSSHCVPDWPSIYIVHSSGPLTHLSFEFCLERFGAIDGSYETLLPRGPQIVDRKPPGSPSSILCCVSMSRYGSACCIATSDGNSQNQHNNSKTRRDVSGMTRERRAKWL